jgi:hypothetical protein
MNIKHRIINVAVTDLIVLIYNNNKVSNISLIKGLFYLVLANLSS